MKRIFRNTFCVLQSFLFLVSSFSVYDSAFKVWVDRAALRLSSDTQPKFDTITDEALQISREEKEQCRKWYQEHILTAKSPAYNFTVGGKQFQNHLSDWEITIGKESALGEVYRGGKTTYVTLKHRKSDITATVEATLYEEYASCDWTVFIQNNGSENSPIVNNFYAADFTFNCGTADIYFSKGSNSDNDDFELMKSAVSPIKTVFNANGGRSSSFLPYFNLCGKKMNAVMAVGWTGQWYTSFSQNIGGVHIKAKQEYFKGYLSPDEKVRSPLVSMTFYSGSNALKGFNTFRTWESECVYTESAFPVTCTLLAGEFDKRNTDQLVEFIQNMPQQQCDETDFLWMDAGWYEYNEGWYDGAGSWLPNKARFPDGLAPISEAAQKRGMKLLLWYEPERCCKGTRVYNECIKHPGWLVECDDNTNLVNLAFDGACDYLGDLVANSIKDNKVGFYRQDFNFTPLNLWQEADKTYFNNRKGFEENHYVTNLYRYLDKLLEVNPGLIIDNCASGGRRLDLEMSRRSIPLWRTDYNCSTAEGVIKDDAITATQYATYGISFWLPLNGTGLNAFTEYADRSLLTSCSQRSGYQAVRDQMEKNYFPLTNGGLDTTSFHAMQFGDGDEGTVLIYRREDVKEKTYRLIMNGLTPNQTYRIYDVDFSSETTTKTGSQLMNEGLSIAIEECPKCAIYLYKAVK
ncbi:MAG TPA: hypothetical protein DDY98_07785 [Ruminococcaceae bacterium]|nr:hypothetical protein [Oscillospiraceae bacterium]